MKKVVLVDGNNLLFRSYYATAYNGNLMKNSKNFPTNAIYGFVNMINKIINEEKPEYMLVAFDKGKTFRHDKYDFYKQGRIETPNELRLQFPKAKDILDCLGIKWFEIDNYEADDIIGTVSKMVDENDEFIATIVSSDKDLLQLISNDVTVKLLKQKDHIMMNPETFKEIYGIDPINMIDLKALAGDSSDNIPGVKGIGEKTALNILKKYKTVEEIYENIDNISGKTREKLLNDKDIAFTCKEIVTIYRDVNIGFDFNEMKLKESNINSLKEIYKDLEFYSFIKKLDFNMNQNEEENDIPLKIINDISEININEECAIYLEIDSTNYHQANILGMAVYNKENNIFIPYELLLQNPQFLNDTPKITYDLKKTITALRWKNISIDNINFDTMISAYLLNYNVKDDISCLAEIFGCDIPSFDLIKKKKDLSIENISKNASQKAKFIYDVKNILITKMKNEEVEHLYYNIEHPLAFVLSDMEYNGIRCDKNILDNMGIEINKSIDKLAEEIHSMCDCGDFNISSHRQVGEVLFDIMKIGKGKKIKSGYSTNVATLSKYRDKHPVVNKIIEYRTLAKLHSTYIEGLKNYIMDDGKIHTIYTQTLTRTGRLSSIEPNLQNIPIRYEEGRLVRKSFIPSEECIFLSSDYSQIELRILAHISNSKDLIDAFNNNIDIHAKTASDIFDVDINDVTNEQRRMAKAVNFGIIYGISGFGLGENLDISPKQAKEFIDKYLNKYSGIKNYMDETVKNAYEKGYVKTLQNRKRIIDELKNTNYMIKQQGERIALNTPIQGTSADIIKIAMINLFDEFRKEKIKSKMILQIHDELVIDTLKEEEKKVKSIVKKVMENVIKLSVPVTVSINRGIDLYDTK